MAADNAQVAQDLGRHAMKDLEAVLNRHMKIAMTALPPADVGMILLQIANGVALGAALYSLQLSKDDKAPDDIWEVVRKSLELMLEAGRPVVLARFEEIGRAEAA